MRQGGYSPKNKKSGVYWVRANASRGRKKKPAVPVEIQVDNPEAFSKLRYQLIGAVLGMIIIPILYILALLNKSP